MNAVPDGPSETPVKMQANIKGSLNRLHTKVRKKVQTNNKRISFKRTWSTCVVVASLGFESTK